MQEQISWQAISCYEATDKLFRVHSLRLYLCLWFCNVNLKKEIKETGREIRKGNSPHHRICVLPTRQERPTLNFLIAVPCVASWEGSLKLFPVATGCAGSVAFRVGQKRSPEKYLDLPNAACFHFAHAGVARRGEGLIVVLVTSRKSVTPQYSYSFSTLIWSNMWRSVVLTLITISRTGDWFW